MESVTTPLQTVIITETSAHLLLPHWVWVIQGQNQGHSSAAAQPLSQKREQSID